MEWRDFNHGCGSTNNAFLPSHFAIEWRDLFSHGYGIVDKAFYLAMQLTEEQSLPL